MRTRFLPGKRHQLIATSEEKMGEYLWHIDMIILLPIKKE